MMSSADRECIQDEWHQNPAIKETSDLGSSCFIAFGDVQRNIDWLFLPETSIYGNSEIMMIVLSRTDNFGRRNVLRKTWMNMNNSEIMTEGRMKALFLVGIIPGDNKLKMMLLEEARVYGDMIVADLNDRYDELTFKIISLLIYATSKTPQVKLIGKVDEDVLFIPDQLTPLIDQRIININASSLYGEVLLYGGQVNHKKGRWFVSKSSFKCDKYPGYLPGPFYLATRSAAIKILSATKHRNLISVEDVFITGLLADDVGVERKNIPNMYMLPSTIISQQTTILAWHTSDNNEKYQELFEKSAKFHWSIQTKRLLEINLIEKCIESRFRTNIHIFQIIFSVVISFLSNRQHIAHSWKLIEIMFENCWANIQFIDLSGKGFDEFIEFFIENIDDIRWILPVPIKVEVLVHHLDMHSEFIEGDIETSRTDSDVFYELLHWFVLKSDVDQILNSQFLDDVAQWEKWKSS